MTGNGFMSWVLHSPLHVEQSGDVICTVRLKADNVDLRIKWGMTMQVSFDPLADH